MSDDPGHDRPERDVLAFDRSDRWGLVGLLLAVSLAACWAWLVSPVVAWAEGEAIPLELTSRVSVPELDAAGLRHGLATYDAADSFRHEDSAGFVRLWGLGIETWAARQGADRIKD